MINNDSYHHPGPGGNINTESWRCPGVLTYLIAPQADVCDSLDFVLWLRLHARPVKSRETLYPLPPPLPPSLQHLPPPWSQTPPCTQFRSAVFPSLRLKVSGTLGVFLMANRQRWHLAERIMVVDTAGGLLSAAPRDVPLGRVHSFVAAYLFCLVALIWPCVFSG